MVGISDDDSKPEAWKKAVEKDQLPWHHVLRGYRTDSDLTKHFAIHSLPTYILLDKEGTIIARYSSDHSELDKKLAELMP
ncbi:TlpA family protein disulfide reductase [Siphonobacter sp. BAB-5405]|uniref:TlpA family protein disulfide reductase n=1 Tax=Siphonobacter sp. BAB-5405 TaxID=1864825 RepID=UPI0026B9F578